MSSHKNALDIQKAFCFGFVVLFLALIFHTTGPRSLPEADSGEFALIATTGGIAHPPGYPLYVMLTMVAANLKGYLPYIGALALVSIVSGALAGGILTVTLFEVTGSLMASIFGVLSVFLAKAVWRSATSVEPFGLNLLLIALVIFASWRIVLASVNEKYAPFRRVAMGLLGLAFAFGACNHHSLVFYIPMALAALVFSLVKRRESFARDFLFFIVGFAIGLLPMTYFAFAKTGVPVTWNKPENLKEFFALILRQDYGTFQLSLNDNGNGLDMLKFFWTGMPREFSLLLIVFLYVGAFEILSRIKKGVLRSEENFFALMMVLAIVFAGGVFFSLFNLKIAGSAETIAYRFFHVAMIPFCALIAFAWMRVGKWIKRPELAFGIVAIVLLSHFLVQLPTANRKRETFVEMDIRNTFRLTSSFKKPLIVTFSDAEFLGFLYGKHVLNLGSNTEIIQPSMWDAPWYRQERIEKLGLDKKYSKGTWMEMMPDLIKSYDVFFASKNDPEAPKFLANAYQFGRLLRIPRNDEEIPTADEVFALNARLFTYQTRLPDIYLNSWEAMLFNRYTEPLNRYAVLHQMQPLTAAAPLKTKRME